MKRVNAVATLLTLAVLCSAQSALGEAKCKQAKGNFVEDLQSIPGPGTGRFAGATGVLFLDAIRSATIAVGPYYEVVGGQVCFVEQAEDSD
jgi:hypothetical protein